MTDLRVRVPATSANLGPGFDAFALALPMVAEFEVRAAHRWSVTVDGAGEGIPIGEDNLFVIGARAAAKAIGSALPPQHITQRSAIPLGRGLGSSAAAIVGGVTAANALLGEPLGRRALLRVAAEVEGHGDNVAAALYGAFTVAVPHGEGPVAVRIAFPATWRVCLLVPADVLATEKARGVLPAQVSRTDAVFNLAHASALVAAVLRSDGALLRVAMQDRLHQAARARLVPTLEDVSRAACDAGAFGAALSGAGPAVLAIAPARLAARVIGAMEEASALAGVPARGRVVRVRAAGAQLHRAS
ncbi:MAG TPA: homoserine kinase [Candidatus Saccharimonadales bacterium]|nr:homoserine kinase [Candidatus Saccharimonadales bacterium]